MIECGVFHTDYTDVGVWTTDSCSRDKARPSWWMASLSVLDGNFQLHGRIS